jgi:hypothetical protein
MTEKEDRTDIWCKINWLIDICSKKFKNEKKEKEGVKQR